MNKLFVVALALPVALFTLVACTMHPNTVAEREILVLDNFQYNMFNSSEPTTQEITTPSGDIENVEAILFAGTFRKTGVQVGFAHITRTYQSQPQESYVDTWLSTRSDMQEINATINDPKIYQSHCLIERTDRKWIIDCLYLFEPKDPLVTEYLFLDLSTLNLSSQSKAELLIHHQEVDESILEYLANLQD